MADYSVHGEVLAITNHACKVLQHIIICANSKALIDDLLRDKCRVAIEDLNTIPHLITQLQPGKRSSVTPRRTTNNRRSHNLSYTKKGG